MGEKKRAVHSYIPGREKRGTERLLFKFQPKWKGNGSWWFESKGRSGPNSENGRAIGIKVVNVHGKRLVEV